MAELIVSPRRHSRIKFYIKRLLELITGYAVRYHVPPREKQNVLFTFDDGPLSPETGDILDLLDSHKEKAIFFVVGEQVHAFPEIAREIVRRGHAIGSHGMTHHDMKKLPLSEFARQVNESFQIIKETCRTSARYFRPPFGSISFLQMLWLLVHGITVFLWSCSVSREGAIDCIHPKGMRRSRPIILLHDYCPTDVIQSAVNLFSKERI